MTAKEFLQQAHHLEIRISTIKLEIERLRSLAESVPSNIVVSGSPGKVTDRTGVIIGKIVDMECELLNEVDRLVEIQRVINKAINLIKDEIMRLVLIKRYLHGEDFEKIAEDMKYHVSFIYKLHRQALKNIQIFEIG